MHLLVAGREGENERKSLYETLVPTIFIAFEFANNGQRQHARTRK
jgi:hypothetical protein